MHRVPLAVLLVLFLGIAACGEDAGTVANMDGALRLDDESMQRFVDLAGKLRDLGDGAHPTSELLASHGFDAAQYAAVAAVVAESSRRNYRVREIARIETRLEDAETKLPGAPEQEQRYLEPMIAGFRHNLEKLRAFPTPGKTDLGNMEVMKHWQARLDDARLKPGRTHGQKHG